MHWQDTIHRPIHVSTGCIKKRINMFPNISCIFDTVYGTFYCSLYWRMFILKLWLNVLAYVVSLLILYCMRKFCGKSNYSFVHLCILVTLGLHNSYHLPAVMQEPMFGKVDVTTFCVCVVCLACIMLNCLWMTLSIILLILLTLYDT